MTSSSPEIHFPLSMGTQFANTCPLFPDPSRATWTIFSSANNNLPQSFKDQAFQLGKFIAERSDDYCFGGMLVGLMGEISRGVMEVRDRQDIPDDCKSAIISVPYHSYYDPSHDRYFQQIHVKQTLKDQQNHLNTSATHFVTLPGGIGTHSEFWHTVEELRWNESYRNKMLWLVNIDGFFDHLLAQIGAMVTHGLARREDFSRLQVVTSIDELKEHFAD